MTLASSLRPRLDAIRSIPDKLGLRPFSVIVRVVTWTGASVGQGTSTFVDTPFLVGGGHRPKVRQMTMRDIVASGGLYHDQDLKVGPVTPAYPASGDRYGGGVAYSTIDPGVSGGAVEVYYRVSGASLPTQGVWYDKFSDTSDHAMNSYMVLRRSAAQNPGGAP